MKSGQPLKVIGDEYGKLALLRELEFIHKRVNDLGISPVVANLKTDYVAGDLGTAAAIATAFNATNAAINQLLAKLNLSA